MSSFIRRVPNAAVAPALLLCTFLPRRRLRNGAGLGRPIGQSCPESGWRLAGAVAVCRVLAQAAFATYAGGVAGGRARGGHAGDGTAPADWAGLVRRAARL